MGLLLGIVFVTLGTMAYIGLRAKAESGLY